MTGAPLISVITPAHNAGRFIGETLKSALGQSVRDLEVVVVDDGSTDDTAAVVEAIAAVDRRVRLIRTANDGVSAARNRAAAEARGKFLAPLDADDLWRPDKLEKQLAALQAAGPEVGVVYCWCAGIDEQGRILAPHWSRGTATGNVLHEVIANGLIGNASAPLIRREVFDAVGGYDDAVRLSEDWKLHIELAARTPFAVVPEDLVGYRFWMGSATFTRGWEKALAGMTRWIRETWPDLPPVVLRRRAYFIDTFLSFLAIRRGDYGAAFFFRYRGFCLRPWRILTMDLIDFWASVIGHLIGWRRYAWGGREVGRPFLES